MDYVLHMASGDRLRITGGGHPDRMPDILKDIEAGRWVTVYEWGIGTLSLVKGFKSDSEVRINGALVERIEVVWRWTGGRSSRRWTSSSTASRRRPRGWGTSPGSWTRAIPIRWRMTSAYPPPRSSPSWTG